MTIQTASCDLKTLEILHYQDEEISRAGGLRCENCETEIHSEAAWQAIYTAFAGEKETYEDAAA